MKKLIINKSKFIFTWLSFYYYECDNIMYWYHKKQDKINAFEQLYDRYFNSHNSRSAAPFYDFFLSIESLASLFYRISQCSFDSQVWDFLFAHIDCSVRGCLRFLIKCVFSCWGRFAYSKIWSIRIFLFFLSQACFWQFSTMMISAIFWCF